MRMVFAAPVNLALPPPSPAIILALVGVLRQG